MKKATEVLYVRIPVEVMNVIRKRASKEQRTIAVTAERMLRHAILCEHKVEITDEL